MNRFIFILTVGLCLLSCGHRSGIEEINDLDKLLSGGLDYSLARRQKIDILKKEYEDVFTIDEKAYAAGRLYRIYFDYDNDKALQYARTADSLALISGNVDFANLTATFLANSLSISGRIGMANNRLDRFDRASASPERMCDYYVSKIIINKEDEQFTSEPGLISATRHRARIYRDSLLHRDDVPENMRTFVNSSRLLVSSRYQDAVQYLLPHLSDNEPWSEDWGNMCYLLGSAYEGLKDDNTAIKYYACAAITNLKAGARTGPALRDLSSLLYKNGDVERAYRYMLRAMSDANASHSIIGSADAAENFVIIENALRQQDRRRHGIFASLQLSVLALLLIAAFFSIKSFYRGRKMAKVNMELKESVTLKEAYLAMSLDQNAQFLRYIGKIQARGLKIARRGNVKDIDEFLNVELRPEQFREDFYIQFDETILKIFPSFVDEFNSLLKESDRIQMKNPGRLTPELRIYALIRLGVTNSKQIAEFLQYSPSTIFNYRTKMRNSSLCRRELFEEKVAEICRP